MHALLLIVLAMLTAVAVLASVWRDREQMGSAKAALVAAGWLGVPSVAYLQFVQVLGLTEQQAGWAALGVVWYALMLARGRLIFMTDILVEDTVDTVEQTGHNSVRRRVRLTQMGFILGLLLAGAAWVIASGRS